MREFNGWANSTESLNDSGGKDWVPNTIRKLCRNLLEEEPTHAMWAKCSLHSHLKALIKTMCSRIPSLNKNSLTRQCGGSVCSLRLVYKLNPRRVYFGVLSRVVKKVQCSRNTGYNRGYPKSNRRVILYN